MFDYKMIVDATEDQILTSIDNHEPKPVDRLKYLQELVESNPLVPIAATSSPDPILPGMLVPYEINRRSRGGIKDLSELDDYSVIRLDHSTAKPRITISLDKIMFNSPCIKLFLGYNYIHMLIRIEQQRIVLLPSGKYEKDSLQWCGKNNQPRVLHALSFAPKLFEVLHWVQDYTYQIDAVYQIIDKKHVVTFNLDECYRLESKNQPMYNVEWLKSFGPLYSEYADTYKVKLDKYFLMSRKQEIPAMIGVVPTPNDIITKQYYITDADEKKQKSTVNEKATSGSVPA